MVAIAAELVEVGAKDVEVNSVLDAVPIPMEGGLPEAGRMNPQPPALVQIVPWAKALMRSNPGFFILKFGTSLCFMIVHFNQETERFRSTKSGCLEFIFSKSKKDKHFTTSFPPTY